MALAARGGHPSGHGQIVQRRVPDRVNTDLLTIIVIVYVAGVIGLIWALAVFSHKWRPVKSNWIRDLFVTLLVFSILAVIGERLFTSDAFKKRAREYAQQQQRSAGKGRQAKPPPTGNIPEQGAQFDWTLAIGILGLIVVGGAVFYVRARLTPLPDPLVLQDDVKEELSVAVSGAIDDLRREPDPRRAVIAAYARMEGVLARRGHARNPAETPFEYLSRILLSLRVREGAVRELTELFERAKFSTHPIDETMKERAISALLSVRDDLTPALAA